MRLRWLLVLGLIAAVILFATVLRDRSPVRSEYCTAKVGLVDAQIDLEQAQWSSLIAAIGIRRGLPPRATTIAIATAFQESKLHNIDYGDRDSLGLFQQRPSVGWGSPEQVKDPVRASRAFFGGSVNPNKGVTRGLLDISGWESMSVSQAAQAVQNSAFPDHYAKWEASARAWLAELG